MDIQAYIESGKIESYVLGLASAEETAEIDLLRLQHPQLNSAIEDFSVMLEEQLLQNAIPPPVEVKRRVMAAIKKDENESTTPVIPLPTYSTPNTEDVIIEPVKAFRRWRMIAAAAILLLVASAGLNAYLFDKYKQRNEDYLALLNANNTLQANNSFYRARYEEWKEAREMMADPAMAVVRMNGLPGKENSMAMVLWNTKNKDVFVIPNKLPQPEKGKQYQLWALVDGKPVDAGVLDPSCSGACKMKNIPKADGFAITLEKAGGNPTPTIEAMYVKGDV